ncbi:putative cyclase [Peniophora sp. CONT]|nr:putative cyclase [Peniophora sp. CONT]
MRTIIDLSQSLQEGMTVCEGHPPFTQSQCCSLERDGSAVSLISLSSHTGTHIDAPAHFIEGGATVDALDLSALIGPVLVIDARGREPDAMLDWDDTFAPYEKAVAPGVAVAICTGWSEHLGTSLYARNPRVAPAAAARLFEAGVRLLCIDALSPDGSPNAERGEGHDDWHRFHHFWLGKGGIIVENLVSAGLEKMLETRGASWMGSFLPLRLEKCDGSPVRAVAWRDV